MARNKLTDTAIKNAKAGTLSDGGRLYLRLEAKGSGRWYIRYTYRGERQVMGLGSYPAVSLAKARKLRDHWESALKDGADPRAVKKKQEAEADLAIEHTLNKWVELKFEALRPQLRNGGEGSRWASPLRIHVLPALGHVPIQDITTDDIVKVLRPIWLSKAVTAQKALNRLSMVLDHAEAGGLDVTRQTVRRAKLLLGAQPSSEEHIPSLHWSEVPAFYASLDESTVELALRLLILSGTRSGSVRNCHADQIDGDVWTIPAAHMKGREGKVSDFRVPLSDQALEVIELAKAQSGNGLLFTGRAGRPLSDMSLSMYMRRKDMEARPHGFRSTLRSWLAEKEISFEVSETILAHVVGNRVARSYQRNDLLDVRRGVMRSWADHVVPRADASSNVTNLPVG